MISDQSWKFRNFLFLSDPALLFMLIISIFVYHLLTGNFCFGSLFFDVFFSFANKKKMSGGYERNRKRRAWYRFIGLVIVLPKYSFINTRFSNVECGILNIDSECFTVTFRKLRCSLFLLI